MGIGYGAGVHFYCQLIFSVLLVYSFTCLSDFTSKNHFSLTTCTIFGLNTIYITYQVLATCFGTYNDYHQALCIRTVTVEVKVHINIHTSHVRCHIHRILLHLIHKMCILLCTFYLYLNRRNM